LAVASFIGAFVAGFTFELQAPGTTVNCGAPFEVVDGGYAPGVPDELKSACQSAANRWGGRAMIPFAVFLIVAIIVTFVFRQRPTTGRRPR